MVGMDAISALLETGSWRTSRSKSQNPYSRTPRRTDPLSELDIHVNKPSETRRRTPRLPPPTVEDEAESLAKEHGSPSVISSYEDEPPNRGEINQEILMEPVLEHNPERRFVVVTGPGAGKEGEPAPSIVGTTPPTTQKEETNGCKKFVLVPSDETKDGGDKQEEKKVSELGKRKSHQDLPRLDTHVQEPDTKDAFIEPPKDRQTPEKTPVYQEDDKAARIKRSSSRRRPEAYADEEDTKKASLKRASSRRRPEISPDDQDSAETSIKLSSSRRYKERPAEQDAKESTIKRSSSRKPRNRPLHDSEITADSPDTVNPGESDFSASVVTETAGGRERAYYDLSQAADGLSHRRSKSKHGARITPSNSRQTYHLSPPQTPGRPRHERMASTPDMSRIDSRSLELEGPGIAPLSMYRYNDADDAMTFMVQEDAVPDHDLTRKSPPPRTSRKGSPPPYPAAAERKRMPSQAAINRRRRNSMAAPRDRRDYPIDVDPRYHQLDHQEQPQPFCPAVEEDASLMALRHRLGSVDIGSESQDLVPHPSALALRQQDQFSEASDPGSSRSATFSAEGDYRRGRAGGTYSLTSSPPNGRLVHRKEDESSPRTRRRARSRTMGTNPYSNSSPILPVSGHQSTNGGMPLAKVSSPLASPSLTRQELVSTRPSASFWDPNPFEPAGRRAPGARPILSFRSYSEEVEQGLTAPLPICPWAVPGLPYSRNPGDRFWTLRGAENFLVCPRCHSELFANSQFRHEFVAISLRPDQHVLCDIGSSFWYRMAYLMTLKQRLPDLQLVRNVAAVSGRNPPCSGPQETSRKWHGMWDPYKGDFVPLFEVCVGCAKMLEAVLPNLANTLYQISPEPFTTYCQLHYAPGRKRFMDYWDLLEATSDIALSHQTEPDIRGLASGLRRIARVKECPPCPKDQALVGAYWHVMQFLPDFTVCEECYREVVKPMLDANDRRSDIPWNFIPERLVSKPIASCQLSSEQMREEFREACRLNDYGYLEGKYIERMGTLLSPVARW
ncbi:hypothetical protein QBC32DRAFT_140505 [Pseudoneurospora amorphoporcata]|uniref:Ser/arg-related nuclear matrix protein n=1 Tax=Pseudoneurospora amorphoporcata TaxID=241081 RepID=A0AAN6NUU4_9PEZI|nr:hypothetical protein QBC32DRAFT_140505 [Pseudoneurospora amorphoporcata]